MIDMKKIATIFVVGCCLFGIGSDSLGASTGIRRGAPDGERSEPDATRQKLDLPLPRNKSEYIDVLNECLTKLSTLRWSETEEGTEKVIHIGKAHNLSQHIWTHHGAGNERFLIMKPTNIEDFRYHNVYARNYVIEKKLFTEDELRSKLRQLINKLQSKSFRVLDTIDSGTPISLIRYEISLKLEDCESLNAAQVKMNGQVVSRETTELALVIELYKNTHHIKDIFIAHKLDLPRDPLYRVRVEVTYVSEEEERERQKEEDDMDYQDHINRIYDFR